MVDLISQSGEWVEDMALFGHEHTEECITSCKQAIYILDKKVGLCASPGFLATPIVTIQEEEPEPIRDEKLEPPRCQDWLTVPADEITPESLIAMVDDELSVYSIEAAPTDTETLCSFYTSTDLWGNLHGLTHYIVCAFHLGQNDQTRHCAPRKRHGRGELEAVSCSTRRARTLEGRSAPPATHPLQPVA